MTYIDPPLVEADLEVCIDAILIYLTYNSHVGHTILRPSTCRTHNELRVTPPTMHAGELRPPFRLAIPQPLQHACRDREVASAYLL